MDSSRSNRPLEKDVVLLGAGNAHLRFVRMFGMRPMPGVAVTLVSEAPVIPYSAMVPGYLAGDYPRDEITIDLVRLCRSAGVRFVSARALGIQRARQHVTFDARPPMRYDVLSLGLGSLPACPLGPNHRQSSWPMRPLNELIERLDALAQQLKRTPRPIHLVVVGGGVSGCELTLAIRKRFSAFPEVRLTLLQSHSQLLPQFPDKAGRLMAGLMRDQGITLRLDALVTGGDEKTLEVNRGERLEYDVVLWATNAAPPPLLAGSGLRVDAGGFLLVADTLQSVTDPAIFGTGDCISIDSHPHLLKNGVYAVRQGETLFENLGRFLLERSLLHFRPQRRCLCLMKTSDGSAILNYGPLVWKSGLALWLKERIDRAWIVKHSPTPGMAAQGDASEQSGQMRCGGCGSKVSSDVLSAVLKRIDVGNDPRVLLGCQAGEDASVHRVRPELFGDDPARLVEVQTVDYFKAFTDDPYLFGRIAALNALSDLFAMNARPFTALAIATLPYARGPVQEGMLHELLSGAVETLRQHGVVLTGGHTTEGSELALGFAVTGFGEEDQLFRKSLLQPGDLLILTRPLGSGALLAAWMRGECPAGWFTTLTQTMLVGNERASKILAGQGVRACTDVTGFGLAGHLLEMLDASGASAHLRPARVPVYQGFSEVVARGIVSTLHPDNAKVACRVSCQGPPPAWLFDPQTSGGLLAGVRPELADRVLVLLRETGYPDAAIVGEVRALAQGEAPVIHLESPG